MPQTNPSPNTVELVERLLAKRDEMMGEVRFAALIGSKGEKQRAALEAATAEIVSALTQREEEIERWRELLEAVLNSSGARGRYHALEYAKAVEQAERALLPISSEEPTS